MEFPLKRENLHGGLSITRGGSRLADVMPNTHVHNYHELYFLLSGARQYFIGHRLYHVSPGELVIIPENELHRTTNYQTYGYERYVIYFPDEYIKDIRDAAGRQSFDKIFRSGCLQFPSVQSEKVKAILKDMERELSSKDPYAYILALGKLNELIACIMRHGTHKLQEAERTASRIQKVAQYISENFSESITLHDAAQMAFMEDSYFSRQFKKLTGFGFVEYLTQVRLKAAAQMLADTSHSISKIAEDCGFSGSNYFGDVFKKLYGKSPVEYRKISTTTKL